ncbi:MAG: helix-turn-helix transcriptional regulator [Minwuia sp.]|uniref:helix-turn-helix transcriptional regulator n=1 Tax=Minwuia sp. TaxID=2493630 RepID=UPI003A8B576D
MEPQSQDASQKPVEQSSEVGELRPLPEDPTALIPAACLPQHLGIALQTLARWRHEGYGPAYVKLGRRVFYRSGDIRRWINERAVDRMDLTASGG